MRLGRGSRVFWLLSGLNLITLVGLWWLETVFAERHWLVTAMTYVPQHPLGIVTVGLIAWALIARDARAVLANLPALALFALFFMGMNVPWRAMLVGKPDGTPLRVVTYNIRNDPATLASMRNLKPDLICAQESDALDDPHLSRQSLISGYESVTWDELTVISRYPIRSHRAVRLPPSEPPSQPQPTNQLFLEALIEVRGVMVRVINVHVWTPDILGRLPRYADLGLRRRVTQFSSNRWNEVNRVLAGIDWAAPVIVCGDFNTPPRGALYNALGSRLTDAFASAGWGPGYTYSAQWPLLRIDYVWTTDRVSATRAFVFDDRISDHRVLVTDLVLGR